MYLCVCNCMLVTVISYLERESCSMNFLCGKFLVLGYDFDPIACVEKSICS